jgi:hypothetical protein
MGNLKNVSWKNKIFRIIIGIPMHDRDFALLYCVVPTAEDEAE